MYAEMYSGGAMAVLEGFAFALISQKVSELGRDNYQAKVLQMFMWALAISTPLIALPYLLTEQRGITVNELFTNSYYLFIFQTLWSILIVAVPMLIVIAIGYADIEKVEVQKVEEDEELPLVEEATEAIKVEAQKEEAEDPPLPQEIVRKVEAQKVINSTEEDQDTFSCPDCSYSGSKMGLAVHSSKCKAKARSNGNGVKVLDHG